MGVKSQVEVAEGKVGSIKLFWVYFISELYKVVKKPFSFWICSIIEKYYRFPAFIISKKGRQGWPA